MKTLKFLVLILFAAEIYTACKKDSTDIRDAFVATYSVTETWTENNKTLTKPAFAMSVEKSTQSNDLILLKNFADYGSGVIADATVSGKSLTISRQTLPNMKVITGSGTLTDSTLNIVYTETYNSISYDISAIAKKK